MLGYRIQAVADMERLDLLSAGADSEGRRRLVVEAVTSDLRVETVEDTAGCLGVVLPAPLREGDTLRLEVEFSTEFDPAYANSTDFTPLGRINPGGLGTQT